jgi:hypothetical protein
MNTINFVSKLEKNPNNPTIYKLKEFTKEEGQQLLRDYMLNQKVRNNSIENFIRRVLKIGIERIENFSSPRRSETKDIKRIDDRLINQLSIFLIIELFAEIMQLIFKGTHV